jgi:hypothetical protein
MSEVCSSGEKTRARGANHHRDIWCVREKYLASFTLSDSAIINEENSKRIGEWRFGL